MGLLTQRRGSVCFFNKLGDIVIYNTESQYEN